MHVRDKLQMYIKTQRNSKYRVDVKRPKQMSVYGEGRLRDCNHNSFMKTSNNDKILKLKKKI